MEFGDALALCREDGEKIAREGWNGKGMYVVYQKGYPNGIKINRNTAEATGMPEGTICYFRPYLLMKAADNTFVPWVASQSDILGNDWFTIDEEAA